MTRSKRKRSVASEPHAGLKKLRERRSTISSSESSSRLHHSRLSSVASGIDSGLATTLATPSRNTSTHVDKYITQHDEVSETEDLGDLLGESEPDPDDLESLPVRILSYFDIYDYQTDERRILPMEVNLDEDIVFFGASGLVRAQVQTNDEDEDEDFDSPDDDSILVKLSAIRDVWTDKHEIWIRTQFAWYILEFPSHRYRRYYGKVQVLARNYSPPKSSRPSRSLDALAPYITPRVGKIAQGLFLRSLIIANERIISDSELQNVCVADIPFVRHVTNPSNVEWGHEVPEVKGFYKSVFVDGVEYHINDTVAVAAPEAFSDVSSEGVNDDKLSNKAWFAQICYFFDHTERRSSKRSRPEKYFHLRWFSHGSQTILGETSNPQALFLLDECDDNPVETILQKITVRQLGPGDLEPVVISDRDVGSSTFHLSHKWDEDNMMMKAVDLEAEQSFSSLGDALAELPQHKQCFACALREGKELQRSCNKLDPDRLEIYGNQYHLYDFVYVRIPSKQRNLLVIAQIVDLLPSSGRPDLQISVFDRAQYVSGEEPNPQEQRTLINTGNVERISASRLDGHCNVARLSEIEDLDAWFDNPDNFLIDHKKPLKQCGQCSAKREALLRAEEMVRKGSPLRALDLFAGAGGLTMGMDLSGYIKTCWAVERCPSACETLRVNHDDLIVYNQDCNVLLKHAAETQEGKSPSPVHSLGKENEILPALPRPGEVDIIMGGPPCQPFSGMNRFKRVDDIRQTCIPTALSYVEFYRPMYALIENVTGLLHYRLNGRQEGKKIVGGVEAGMVKFIMRAFSSLGYQCQMRVLNSADYGSPQQRNRVIFWASRLDVALPKWPIPTHIPRSGHNTKIRRIGEIGFAPIAARNEFEDGHEYAPFYAVTVNEAIDDLPSWDWENPGILYPKGKKQPKSDKPKFPADTLQWKSDSEDARQVSGYNYDILYASPPRNLYQAFLRKGQSKSARVDLHFTSLFSIGVVERTINVPMRPSANFKDLPRSLQESMKKKKARNDTFWRLDGEGQFKTLMTLVNPSSKGAYVIHPTDKRVLTYRELARAQGFPDHYEFCSVEESRNSHIREMARQIGNAVPVHLAYALGRALGEGLVETQVDRGWEQEERDSASGWDARTDRSEEL
ncbi:hypothetical protein ACEPAH_4500 [Sanghuangporus vaninii]